MGQNIIYQKGPLIVFYCGTGYIVHNTKKEFEGGHTHLVNLKSCIDAIHFVTCCKIPERLGEYYAQSLIRLSTNTKYIKRLNTFTGQGQGTDRQRYYNKKVR